MYNLKSYTSPPAATLLRVVGEWGFEDLMREMDYLDLQSIRAGDPLAYATGYLIGKTGGLPEPQSDRDYGEGYRLGLGVHLGEATPPPWDWGAVEFSPDVN